MPAKAPMPKASAPASEELEPKGGKPSRPARGRYVSDNIQARRSRMLEAAKAMIAEGGESGFTIREMSRRARVSVTTVYATFGDKEGLIAAAIEDYYDKLTLSRAPPTTSLSVLAANTDQAIGAILGNRAYAGQYAALYFSGTVHPRIHQVILNTTASAAGHPHWYRKAVRDGEVTPGLTFEAIKTMHANQMMMVLFDWSQGRIRDEDLATALKTAFLIMARGITLGRTQARVEAQLKTLLRASLGSESTAA